MAIQESAHTIIKEAIIAIPDGKISSSQSPPDNSSIINQFKQGKKKVDDVLKVTVSCITKRQLINVIQCMH